MTNPKKPAHLPIVSSAHLASDEAMTLSEFEYALTMVNNAFQRWMLACSATSEFSDLSPLDILVVHNLHHRERPKRIADVAFILNIEDIHNVSYSVRKLVKRGLVTSKRSGKDTYYLVTEQGKEFCLSYRDIREQCLVEVLGKMNIHDQLGEVATLMRTLSGFYDQASRAARSL
ncbi:MarR family transcriptional regulator [Alginatibacterium sediminis]|uniref:MarR family transcriptional regulator n=1 Tax=Alginatibacterium sediminis TaxID=2164068 RepID=A0A420EBM6_9ALTE|nr:winged helix DNA-binding protein [Alginatibacterium sediminis]RKF18088.1 MarR family transcriptional regulator [Alginatibacterium sediminis]